MYVLGLFGIMFLIWFFGFYKSSDNTEGSIQITSVTDEEAINHINASKDEALKVEIKDSKFDHTRIIPYEGETINQFEFRPQTWEQFIGQEEAKARAKTIIKKVKKNIRGHLILSAIKGHGKTTFIELLAKSMRARLIKRIGKQLNEDSLIDIINEINSCPEKEVIFFIDEIDTMDWKILKILNPIIEQFEINGKKIKPFVFASATINKHTLIKNNPDTLDRIPHHIQFHRYTANDISKIITQYKNHLYTDENIPKEAIEVISHSCKFNPRTAIALLEDYIIERNMNIVLKNNKIIRNGLNDIDISVLKILNNSTRAIGANSLAMQVGLSQNQYIREFEPFLVEFGYIARIPSRIITQLGRITLEKLNDKIN